MAASFRRNRRQENESVQKSGKIQRPSHCGAGILACGVGQGILTGSSAARMPPGFAAKDGCATSIHGGNESLPMTMIGRAAQQRRPAQLVGCMR